jgi:hypothetical protein
MCNLLDCVFVFRCKKNGRVFQGATKQFVGDRNVTDILGDQGTVQTICSDDRRLLVIRCRSRGVSVDFQEPAKPNKHQMRLSYTSTA